MKAPSFYGLHTRLGMIYEQSGCYSDAETEFSRAGELSPRSSQPLLNLARAQIQGSEGMPDEREILSSALENVTRALALKPSSAVAHAAPLAPHMRGRLRRPRPRKALSRRWNWTAKCQLPAADACLFVHASKEVDGFS